MEQEQITLEDAMEQNMALSKELWQTRSHLALREVYIIELNQHIMNLNKELLNKGVVDEQP